MRNFVRVVTLAAVVVVAGASVALARHGEDRGKVAIDRDRYLKTVNQLIKDIAEIDDRNESNPKKDDRKWIRERLEDMRKDLVGVRGDLENAPVVADGPGIPNTPFPPPTFIPPPPPEMKAMTPPQFAEFIAELKKQSFDSDRLKLLREVVQQNWFTTDQVIQAMGLFSFSSEKIAAGTAMYPRVVDQNNWYKVYSTFSFSSDQDKLRKQTSGK